MPAWVNIVLAIFYVIWLCAVLILLWMIWYNGNKRAQTMDKTRIEAAMQAANAAICASEAAHKAAEASHILASHIEERLEGRSLT